MEKGKQVKQNNKKEKNKHKSKNQQCRYWKTADT